LSANDGIRYPDQKPWAIAVRPLPKRFDRLSVDAIDPTISISTQGTDRRDELTIADLPALFFRARRFKVAVNFRGLRRSLSIPCRA
jgi:hypothetical protein